MFGKREHMLEIIRRLEKLYPSPKTELVYKTPFELLAATILSAQATDASVNRATEKLFKKFKSVKAFAEVPLEEIDKMVAGINFYHNKAKNIKACAGIIMDKHHGKVPDTMAALLELPGVARKTANIVLSNIYGINEGIAVDTHVKRLSQRLQLTSKTDPVKIEQDLIAITPRERWSDLSHMLILHGRRICTARAPKHKECVLFDICPSNNI